jgi:hypothetical protein
MLALASFSMDNIAFLLFLDVVKLLTDRDEMSNLYKGPSIDAAYQGSVHWPAVSEEKIFKNWPIRNKNCLWRPCLLMDRDKISNLTTPVNHILKTHFFRQAFLSF